MSSDRETFSKKRIVGLLKLNMFLHFVLNWGKFFPSRGDWAKSVDIFTHHKAGIQLASESVEAREAGKHLMTQRTDLNSKEVSGQNVNSAEVESILNPRLG